MDFKKIKSKKIQITTIFTANEDFFFAFRKRNYFTPSFIVPWIISVVKKAFVKIRLSSISTIDWFVIENTNLNSASLSPNSIETVYKIGSLKL